MYTAHGAVPSPDDLMTEIFGSPWPGKWLAWTLRTYTCLFKTAL